jgi:acyl carrier protein
LGENSPGEIHLGGAGLARGYLNRPELTAERFIPHPFDSRSGAGDLGRFQADGSLEHLGRMDYQVKLRGFRIELGEIEAVLERQPSVRQAIVLAREDSPGDKRLVAYMTTATGQPPNSRALREKLRATLPDYMIPATFVFIDRLLMTPNGKVDRNALPVPGPQRPHLLKDYVAPRTSNEERLAAICADVLRIDRIGIQDNLFDLGADSIKLAQVVARICETFHTELPLHLLFENPTVASLMPEIECAPSGDRSATQAALQAIPRTRRLPLSFSQERVWFIHQLHPENLAYNFQSTIRLRGPLDGSRAFTQRDRPPSRNLQNDIPCCG